MAFVPNELLLWVIVAALFIALAPLVLIRMFRKGAAPEAFPYQKLDKLLTPAERSFFGALNQAVGEQVQVFAKVRVADVIAPKKGLSRSGWQKAFNRISAKHFDFLLCNKDDLSVLCAVELNDGSHQSVNRQKRDAFLEQACNAAGVPLIQFPAKAGYELGQVKERLASFLNARSTQPNEQLPTEAAAETHAVRKCPKCSAPVLKRVASKGEHVGKAFWACSAFPKCRYIEPITVSSAQQTAS